MTLYMIFLALARQTKTTCKKKKKKYCVYLSRKFASVEKITISLSQVYTRVTTVDIWLAR